MLDQVDSSSGPGPSSPFTTLPNEVTSLIFLKGTEAWRELQPARLPFPILVSGVCSQWRSLSHNSPELWTFIIPPFFRGVEDCLQWVREWLGRSGAMLVSVVLDQRLFGRPNDYQTTIAGTTFRILLELLSLHTRRLRRLDVRSDWPGTFQRFIAEELDAPHLEQLSLVMRSTRVGDAVPTSLSIPQSDDQPPHPALWHTPNLRKLRLKTVQPPPVSNLTSLTVHCLRIDIEGTKMLFTHSPDLTHLVLPDLLPINGLVPDQLERIAAPSLRSVAVSFFATPNEDLPGTYIFNLLNIPNLVYLELSTNIVPSSLFKGALSNPSSVKTLRMCKFNNRSRQEHEFFESLLGLQELQLIETPILALLRPDQRPRRRSIGLRDPAYRSRQGLYGPQYEALHVIQRHVDLLPAGTEKLWPELKSVKCDILSADMLMPLIQFVIRRNLKAECRKIQLLYLSRTSMRHLSESMRRDGEEAILFTSSIQSHRLPGDDWKDRGTKDLKEWLSRIIDVKMLPPKTLGLWDLDGVPLEELP